MRFTSPIGFGVLLVSPASNAVELTRSIFSQRCSDICVALVRDATLSTSCQEVCDALEAEEEEPCIQALTNTTDEQLTLMSYSSGHYFETASILAGIAEEANPEYLRFVEHLRLSDRGSPAACHSLDAVHYCLIQDPSMSLGLCVPNICDSGSISEILATMENISIASSDSRRVLVDGHVYGVDAAPTGQASFAVVCGKESRLDVDAGTILALLFVCFLFSLTVAGTLLDFRKEARLVTSLPKHSLVDETNPEVDAHAPGHEKQVVLLGSENGTRVSEEGADQQESSDLSPDAVQATTPATFNLEARTGGHEAAGTTTLGGVRTSSRYGRVDALGSNQSAMMMPLLGPSAPEESAVCEYNPWWNQCLICFSLRKNMGKLFAPPSSSNAFGALDGIRTLTNLWVVLLHSAIIPLLLPGGGVTNTVDILAFNGHGALSSVPAQIIHVGNLAVDTFFLISGFLASVTLLPLLPRIQSGSRSVSSWVLGRYWHRYLRLMPTTAFITLVNWQLLPLVSDGPTWWPFAELLKESCRRDWWTEITFVQNVVPWPPRAVQCIDIGWSLGIEMQFFIGAVPLIALFHYRPRVSVATLLSIMAASCLYTLWFGFYQDVRFPSFYVMFGDRNSLEDWTEVYRSPQFRCPVYIMGVLYGMAWHTHHRGRTTSTAQRLEGQSTDDPLATIDRILVPVGFTTSALLMSLPVFGAYWANRDMMEVQIPAWADHVYLAFSRPAFASGVALVSGLCFYGRGGVVNWLLTLPIWSPLSRLTFCSYLIHTSLLTWLFLTRSVPFRYTTFETTVTFFGITGAAFISATVVHLLVEAPFRNLESWARKRVARKPSRQ